MQKSKKQTKNIRRASSHGSSVSRQGVRSERLARDGLTFTALTALPRTLTPKPAEYSLYQEYTLLNWFTTSNSVSTFMAHYVNLSSIDQATSLAVVFDQYMIDAVEAWLIPNQSAGTTTSNGLLYSVIDLDDATNLTSVAQFGDYANCVTTQSAQGHYRHFVPHVALAGYAGTFTGFANKPYQWLDTSSPSIQHYGLKFGSTVSAVLTYDLVVRAHFRFRSVR